MDIVTICDVTETAIFTFAADASDLQIRPGLWPDVIKTTMGNGLVLMRVEYGYNDEKELQFVKYKQTCSPLTLKVFND